MNGKLLSPEKRDMFENRLKPFGSLKYRKSRHDIEEMTVTAMTPAQATQRLSILKVKSCDICYAVVSSDRERLDMKC